MDFQVKFTQKCVSLKYVIDEFRQVEITQTLSKLECYHHLRKFSQAPSSQPPLPLLGRQHCTSLQVFFHNRLQISYVKLVELNINGISINSFEQGPFNQHGVICITVQHLNHYVTYLCVYQFSLHCTEKGALFCPFLYPLCLRQHLPYSRSQ